MVVRTRFAPSPTGSLHIGSVRTALFSWLFARHHQGEFILRIEDTDQERSTQQSVDTILESMHWLGLNYDLGPYYQTHRYARYLEIATQLFNQGQAYYCECSKERLQRLREEQLAAKLKPRYDGLCRHKNLLKTSNSQVLRFKNPESGTVHFFDEVYGEITIDNQELDDLILIRTDGHPTYNFAVVVDDFDMKITHVIRGDDHINNTPRQINIFNALTAPIPTFAHLPMILGADGKRLSKRHGAVNVLEFKKLGFLPHAILNYLVRLGWSAGDQEIFSIQDMIARFNLKNVSRAAASFNFEKLCWLNQHYQKNDPPAQVAQALAWHFEQKNIDLKQGPALIDLIPIQAERCKTLAEICEKSQFFYSSDVQYDDQAVEKYLTESVLLPLQSLYEYLMKNEDWTADALQAAINHTCAEYNLGMGKIAQPLRVAVTGGTTSPSIDKTLELLGREKCLNRLNNALKIIKKNRKVNNSLDEK